MRFRTFTASRAVRIVSLLCFRQHGVGIGVGLLTPRRLLAPTLSASDAFRADAFRLVVKREMTVPAAVSPPSAAKLRFLSTIFPAARNWKDRVEWGRGLVYNPFPTEKHHDSRHELPFSFGSTSIASSRFAMCRLLLQLIGFAVCFSTCANVCTAAETVPAQVRQFVKQNCLDCHDGADAEAGFDLASLSATDGSSHLANPAVLRKWVRALDRVEKNEMPPADVSEVKQPQRTRFLKHGSDWLTKFQKAEFQSSGRVRARRLTNLQLERTLHDLLGIDIPLASELPDEPRTNGFTTVANGQPMSHFQLERHLSLVDKSLDEAFRRVQNRDNLKVQKFTARQLCRRNPRRRTREPEYLDGAAVVWSTNTTFYGRLPVTTARENGWYRFTVKASALNKPKDHGVWCSVRSGRGVSSAPLLSWVDGFELTNTPREWTFDAWLKAGDMLEIRPADKTLKLARFQGGQVGAGEGTPQKVPGLAMHSMTMQRIHKRDPDWQIRRNLFADLKTSLERDAKTRRPLIKVKTDKPKADIEKLLTSFATQAFRRPVVAEEIQDYVAFAHEALDEGARFSDALRSGYRALLCSPRFLYFKETPGELDDYAIASRLSYFLWNSMPDKELLRLAAQKKLRDQSVLRRQTDRMLNHERGRNFVADFAHEWLELSEIDFTQPDRRQFRDFDVVVQESMLDETHAYLQKLLTEDLSVTHLIDSDFTFLNSRLARYYGIRGVEGDELQQIALLPEHHRGGVMTQGAILKVTANGTNTSPVVRGTWVAERLLGAEIPPPPENIPAIEPDIRGAKTIREQLEKHRADTSCASCHKTIDPPGFALENYDPTGRWRNNYRINRGRKRGPKIDAGYKLADGRSFRDVSEFRRLIVSNPENLARNLTEKLITWGTGAPIAFVDRPVVQNIVQETADNNYGVRSLVHAIVRSPIFLSK